MDVNWQHNNPPNPAAAAIGPQGYDNHLYYRYVHHYFGILPMLISLNSFGVSSPYDSTLPRN